MSARVVVDVVGVRVSVRVHGDGAGLRAALGELVVSTAPDDADVTTSVDAGGNVEAVLAAAVRAAVERSPHLLLHAGAVAVDGDAVLLPARSGGGKSTLTAACLRHGMAYLTDEMVALDLETGAVRGLARPLMLTPWSMETLGLHTDTGEDAARPDRHDAGHDSPGKYAVAADRLGADVERGWLRAAHVVVPRREHGSGILVPMPAGALLQEILGTSFNHYRHAARAWQAAVRLADAVRGWWLDVDDLATAAESVRALVGVRA